MKREFSVLKKMAAGMLLALLLAGCAAQTAQVEAPVDRHPLWVLESAHGKVYLLGSVHLLGPEQYPLPQVMQDAYRNSGTLVLETDIDGTHSKELQRQLLISALYTDGKTLKEHISPELFAKVQSALKRLGHNPNELTPFKPWFGAMLISMLDFQAAGNKPEFGLDQHFSDKARQDGKRMLYFERPEFQISLLKALDGPNQVHLLEQSVGELKVNGSDVPDQMVTLWKAGDAEGMYRLIKQGFHNYPMLKRKLLDARNRDWLPRIEKLAAQDGNTLIVVGVGHLVGPKGVVALLKRL
jgi:hypothetical protein